MSGDDVVEDYTGVKLGNKAVMNTKLHEGIGENDGNTVKRENTYWPVCLL